jgi:multiple sugar transport system permease protein
MSSVRLVDVSKSFGPVVALDDLNLEVADGEFQSLYYTDWPLLMAASLVAVLPVLVLYVFAQRYFVAGIATTGIR